MQNGHGYFLLSRKFFKEDEYWNEDRARTKAEAWIDIINMAAWKTHIRVVDDIEIPVGRGELLVSYRFLARRWKWSVNKVRRFFATLIEKERISAQQTGRAGTVYLVTKYDSYQSPPEKVAH